MYRAKRKTKPKPSLAQLAQLVKALQRHGITQAQIARVAGVHFTTVSKVLFGKTVSAHVLDTAQRLLDLERARDTVETPVAS